MTPQTCKQLLEMGILQAYAEGKEVQTKACGKWVSYDSYNFDSPPENYRIKPEPQFEVGDLVRSPHNIIYKVTKTYPDACELSLDTDTSRLILHNDDLTKVYEVRTPFTFEQAVKACAEHGMVLSNGSCTFAIRFLSNDCLGLHYLETTEVSRSRYKDAIHSLTFLDNTPFCNISYEPIPTN